MPSSPSSALQQSATSLFRRHRQTTMPPIQYGKKTSYAPYQVLFRKLGTWTCDPSIIKLNEGCPLFVCYSLLGYVDSRTDSPIDGLTYVNTAVSSCEVAYINIVQRASGGGGSKFGIMISNEIIIYRSGFHAILRLCSPSY